MLGTQETAALIFSKPPLHRRMEMCLLYDGFFSFTVVRQIKILNYNSLMVAVIGMLQMRFAGAKGARREMTTSSTSIPKIDVEGICHAVPQ